jgi:hypothetical protein
MRHLLGLLLMLVPARAIWAQAAAADTLPERVVSEAYSAFNRHDPVAFLSYFAPVWHSTVLEDTATAPKRQVREETIRDYVAVNAFATKPTITVTRRMVVGPYVIDEQVRGPDGHRHLDIFEVRQGKIVREWESGPLGTAP